MVKVAAEPSEGERIAMRVYDACAARAAAEPRRRYLGMSQIGRACRRRLWLDMNAPRPGTAVEGRMARVFDMGRSVEDRVIRDLRDAGFTVDGEQEEFSDFDGRFRGHCDGVVRGVTDRPHILEIKSANSASFGKFRSRGIASSPEYSAQVQCYMGYSRLERALFVVECKDNQELYVERVHFDAAAFQALRSKALEVLSALTPPDRAAGGCMWCPFDRGSGLCAEADAEGGFCGDCAWFEPGEDLRARGLMIEGDLCVFRKAPPAGRLGRCGDFEPCA